MINPMDVFIIDTLVKTTGFRIDPVVCTRSTIFDTIHKLYGGWESSGIPMPSLGGAAKGAAAADEPIDVIDFSGSSLNIRRPRRRRKVSQIGGAAAGQFPTVGAIGICPHERRRRIAQQACRKPPVQNAGNKNVADGNDPARHSENQR